MKTITAYKKNICELVVGKSQTLFRSCFLQYYKHKYRKVDQYIPPNPDELFLIEKELEKLDVALFEYKVDLVGFKEFKKNIIFPYDYHGGVTSGIWQEKLLEHYVAYHFLSLSGFKKNDIYIDVAACGSPWSKLLRELQGIQAYAIDLELSPKYSYLDYYRKEDAINTSFLDSSVRGVSLQCAYEMFCGNDDINLISELKRILVSNGKAIISPLYMHTHYCCYSTPEFYGKGHSDKEAKEYIRMDCHGVPSSRKYEPLKLKERILDKIEELGMQYKIFVLRNKSEIGQEIYCHFILEISK